MSQLFVYGDYTQEALNAQYNQGTLVPDIAPYMEYWTRAGTEAYKTLTCKLDVSYGSEKVELLDIFPAGIKNSPIHVHIHGGAWRQLGKEHYPIQDFVERKVVKGADGKWTIVSGAKVLTDSRAYNYKECKR